MREPTVAMAIDVARKDIAEGRALRGTGDGRSRPSGGKGRAPAVARRLHYVARALIAAFTLGFAGASSAHEFRVTTWNLEHFMGEEAFERWRAFCEPAHWDDARAAGPRPPGVTYCSAHSGLSFPEKKPNSLALRTWEAYRQKVDQLRARAEALASDVFALQEVSDAKALRLVFPEGQYRVFASVAPIAQQIAFAVREPLPGSVTVRQLDSFAIKDEAGHRVRPALELTIPVGTRVLKILNVHLKASCARYVIDEPDLGRTKDADHRRAVQEGCAMLRRQVPELENWVDERAARAELFMLVGDFNRDFGWELKNRLPARLPGSDSMDPKERITPATRIAGLLSELSDRAPAGAFLWLARQSIQVNRYQGRETCHRGIDNFLLGSDLAKELVADVASLRAQGADYGKQAYGLTAARPSDHCPFTLGLRFR